MPLLLVVRESAYLVAGTDPKEDGSSFTVLVKPEEWARIASPLDPHADDPQDFNQLTDDEAYLVFYEDRLVSCRPT